MSRIRSAIDTGSSVVLAAAAVAMVALVATRQFGTAEQAESRTVPLKGDSAWTQLRSTGRMLGGTDSPVAFVVYSDFECPACRLLAQRLQRLETSPDVPAFRVAFRHAPLDAIHPSATPAAIAAECAHRLGHFATFHDELFRHQDTLGEVRFAAVAELAGVEALDDFQLCLADQDAQALVADRLLADELLGGIVGTPTVVSRSEVHRGVPSMDYLAEKITDASRLGRER